MSRKFSRKNFYKKSISNIELMISCESSEKTRDILQLSRSASTKGNVRSNDT